MSKEIYDIEILVPMIISVQRREGVTLAESIKRELKLSNIRNFTIVSTKEIKK